uniref:Uncharacterized protein n=1 Tax=Sphaerodactylus townsendi TaxID=933632 RepID=A0ACB8EM32_9SAUR
MPRKKDTVLSSEEESDEASYGRQTPDKQSGEEDSSPERARSAAAATGKTRKKTSGKDPVSRQKKEARKMAAADHDGAGSAPEGPQCLVIPGQGLESQAAPSEDQTMTEVQDEGEAKSGEGTSKRKSTSLHKGDGRFSNLCSSSYGIIGSRKETPMAKSVADRLEI